MKRYFKEHKIQVQFAPEDEEILKHTVDFISFSYYMSICASADPDQGEAGRGNLMGGVMNPYLKLQNGDGRSIQKVFDMHSMRCMTVIRSLFLSWKTVLVRLMNW